MSHRQEKNIQGQKNTFARRTTNFVRPAFRSLISAFSLPFYSCPEEARGIALSRLIFFDFFSVVFPVFQLKRRGTFDETRTRDENRQ